MPVVFVDSFLDFYPTSLGADLELFILADGYEVGDLMVATLVSVNDPGNNEFDFRDLPLPDGWTFAGAINSQFNGLHGLFAYKYYELSDFESTVTFSWAPTDSGSATWGAVVNVYRDTKRSHDLPEINILPTNIEPAIPADLTTPGWFAPFGSTGAGTIDNGTTLTTIDGDFPLMTVGGVILYVYVQQNASSFSYTPADFPPLVDEMGFSGVGWKAVVATANLVRSASSPAEDYPLEFAVGGDWVTFSLAIEDVEAVAPVEDEENPPVPSGPAGAATFAYLLENGFMVTYSWQGSVFKSVSSLERRESALTAPRQVFDGQALLTGDDVRLSRAILARFAASGLVFRIAMSWEELTLAADSDGTSVFVHAAAAELSDWAIVQGQRVIVIGATSSMEGYILSFTAGDVGTGTPAEIVLSVEPGAIGAKNGKIMPTSAVLLEPSQGFARYGAGEASDAPERWQVIARAIEFGFSKAATQPRLKLLGIASGGALDGVTLHATIEATDVFGSESEDITFELSNDGTGAGQLVENLETATCKVKFEPDVTTVANLATRLGASSLIDMDGTFTGSDVLVTLDDFPATALTGGTDAEYAEVGVGATVATYAGIAVFDRELGNESTVNDEVQLLTEVIDFGGALASAADTTVPDWGRQITFSRTSQSEWQWLKRFLDTIRGRWKPFWLPTWRADMVYVSGATDTITVSGGDIGAWLASRNRLQILLDDDSVLYTQIVDSVNDDDAGTSVLTLSVPIPGGSSIVKISWLEVCRMESDSISISFNKAGFAMSTKARVIQRTVTDDA